MWPGADTPLTRLRPAPQQIDAATGRPLPPAYQTTGPVLAGIHEAGPDDLEILREGDRTREARMVVTALDLRPSLDQPDSLPGDVVEFEGVRWRVMAVTGRNRASRFFGGGWTEALVVREQPMAPAWAPEPEP